MAASIKIKRVTDPLNDEAKARIVCDFSSGSEHSAAAADDDSPCLSHLLHGFLEYQGVDGDPASESDSDIGVDSDSDAKDAAEDFVKRIVAQNADPFRNELMLQVSKAIALLQCRDLDRSDLRRTVMAFLRGLGHNAAICKARWESSGGLTAGNYEYIDVIRSDSSNARYFVDLDFAEEFEIARPTQQYKQLLRSVPAVFVGRGEDLKLIVKATSDAMKRSLKTRGLSLPPWRKNRYMQNKWFSSYRRTVNAVPANKQQPRLFPANCLRLGFDGAKDGHLIFPSTTTLTR